MTGHYFQKKELSLVFTTVCFAPEQDIPLWLTGSGVSLSVGQTSGIPVCGSQ
jgi:hypothetical protein